MSKRKDRNWVVAQRALTWMARMYPHAGAEDVTDILVQLADGLRQGRVGLDACKLVREAFRSISRNGWNEDDEPHDWDVMDGVLAAVDHYHDGSVFIEELAQRHIFEAIENGDPERAAEIQAALHEWEWSLTEFETTAAYQSPPVVQVVDEETGEVSYKPLTRGYEMEQRIRAAYAGQPEKVIAAALQASSTEAGYSNEEVPDLLHQFIAEQVGVEQDEHVPVYIESEYPFDAGHVEFCLNRIPPIVLVHIRVCTEMALEALKSMRHAYATASQVQAQLDEAIALAKRTQNWKPVKEKKDAARDAWAMFNALYTKYIHVRESARATITRLAREEVDVHDMSPTEQADLAIRLMGEVTAFRTLVRDAVAEGLSLDLDDEDVYFFLYERGMDTRVEEIEGTKEDVVELYRMLSLPPEHPEWEPQHDFHWLVESGVLTTRQPIKLCYKAGWAAYNKPELKAYRREAAVRHNAGQFELVAVENRGLRTKDARLLTWERALRLDGKLVQACTFPEGTERAAFIAALQEQPQGRQILEVLQ